MTRPAAREADIMRRNRERVEAIKTEAEAESRARDLSSEDLDALHATYAAAERRARSEPFDRVDAEAARLAWRAFVTAGGYLPEPTPGVLPKPLPGYQR